MLTFEITESGKSIQIFADEEGVSVLQKALEKAINAGHVHLRSSTNGGQVRISRKEGHRFTTRRSMVSCHVGPELMK